MNFLEEAQELQDEIITNRRHIHANPETGFDLPNTKKFVMDKLTEYGYQPKEVGKSGVTCTIGQGDKTFLLRADMDALPMAEKSGLEFSSTNANAHTCGHDTHTAMLLGAAKLLKQYESELKGCVKFMFQPAEEILAGAKDMIEHGVLENPRVDAAMALHIVVGTEESKTGVIYTKANDLTYSGDAIEVAIKGRDAHGSTPFLGIDAVLIASQTVVALQNIVAKEVAPAEKAVVLVGKIAGGTAVNSVAGEASLGITVRARNHETRNFLKRRVKEISENVAMTFGGEATVEFLYGMPSLANDANLTDELKSYCQDLLGQDNVEEMTTFNGTEDFSMLTERLPAVLFTLGVGSLDEGHEYAIHHPEMIVNEDALVIGAATYAHCAHQWLKHN